MARPDKATAVAELAEQFRSSNAALLTEYRGLSVAQLQQLRRSLGENAQYAVVKNTLTKIAARQAGLDQLEALLEGPSAIAFVSGDPVEAAKGLRDFSRTNPMLVIKGGVLEGRALSPDEIRQLADLESREVLLAKLAGAMLASLSQAAALFQAPLSQAARVIEALRQKAAEDPSILAGGQGSTATADAAASPQPAAEGDASAPPAEPAGEAATGSEAPSASADEAATASEAPREPAAGTTAEAAAEPTISG